MKILFCAPFELKKELGKSKIMIELGEALSKKGWECSFLGREETLQSGGSENYDEALLNCLKKRAQNFDIIEFEHDQYDFCGFNPPSTLMVSRVSLLAFHYLEIRLPHFSTWKDRLKRLFGKDPFWGDHIQKHCERVKKTCEASDLINVANDLDREALIRHGIPREKITKIPYGLSDFRLGQLEGYEHFPSSIPTIVWIGTFDQRKGAVDLAKIIPGIMERHPKVRWKLLGTAGVFQTKEEVYQRLPSRYHDLIEVIPKYDSTKLLDHLQGCWMGLFPSYIESFGFAVLEMMSVGIPVVAYHCPGPQEMLPPQMLVTPGDTKSIIKKLEEYLGDTALRLQDGIECRKKSREFTWDQAADLTIKAYAGALDLKRA
jgi:glycosyltransferase involved in cell wall biosynthesis